MQERLSKKFALPVFASDAISSTAYATEEILLALVLAGTAGAAAYSFCIAVAVVVLARDRRPFVPADRPRLPERRGSYIVSRENLGLLPGLIAAASLMVDYVMTVAVSTASGVAAIITAFPVARTATGVDLRGRDHPRRAREPPGRAASRGASSPSPPMSSCCCAAGWWSSGFVRWPPGIFTPLPITEHAHRASQGARLAVDRPPGLCGRVLGHDRAPRPSPTPFRRSSPRRAGMPSSPSASWRPSWAS